MLTCHMLTCPPPSPSSQEFTVDAVRMTVRVEASHVAALREGLRDASGGQMGLTLVGEPGGG